MVANQNLTLFSFRLRARRDITAAARAVNVCHAAAVLPGGLRPGRLRTLTSERELRVKLKAASRSLKPLGLAAAAHPAPGSGGDELPYELRGDHQPPLTICIS